MPTGDLPDVESEKDVVVLEIVDADIRLHRWISYSVNSNFLTPTDGWSVELAWDSLTASQRRAVVPGAEVRLTVNNHQQLSGYIDEVATGVSRSGGATMRLGGRDRVGQVVDACADPTQQFKASMTILDVLKGVFGPYGWSLDDKFHLTNDVNRNAITGNTRGTKTSKKGKPLKSYALHQLRPYPNEGAFAFAARICQRRGLWIWGAADGNSLVVGKPDFDQDASYAIRVTATDGTRVLNASVTRELSEQPSIIVADGFAGGGEFGKSRIKSYMENPALDVNNGAIIAKFPNAKKVTIPFHGTKIKIKAARPLYLHDDEAKTQEQLDNFIRREMALRLRNGLTATYEVEGHVSDGNVWAVDTIVTVKDEVAGIDEPLWVLSRTFKKSRAGGTTTDLELIRPHSLEF